MPRLNKVAMASGFMLTLGAVAFANDAGNWLMGPNQGYAVNMKGEPRIINLNIDDAQWLYEWADVGTQVDIHY